jgi:hypothetical protein
LTSKERRSLLLSGMRVGEIGFVWLCLPAVSCTIYFHNTLSQKTLRQFVPAQIGFVFSNRQAGETPDLLFSIYYLLFGHPFLRFRSRVAEPWPS